MTVNAGAHALNDKEVDCVRIFQEALIAFPAGTPDSPQQYNVPRNVKFTREDQQNHKMLASKQYCLEHSLFKIALSEFRIIGIQDGKSEPLDISIRASRAIIKTCF